MSGHLDAIVLGAGPAGEVAANALARAGLRVALVERELIGGECGYWACMPTKTLLRPPEVRSESERTAGVATPQLDWRRVAAYRDWMIRHLDDSKQVASYEKRGITVVKAEGRLAGPGRVEADGRLLEAERIVVATGSEPVIPPIPGLPEAGYWTNREATTLHEIPASAIVVGGGPVGIELAQILARFGSKVTIVQAPERLINREDPQVGTLVAKYLEEEGIGIRLGRPLTSVRLEGGRRVVTLDDGEELSGEALVIGTGRKPRTEGLGLDTIGVDADQGGIPVDERCRVTDGVWAVGDVTGISLFTHTGKYQARIATADILGKDVKADYRAVPRVVFSDPEIAAVGLTEEKAREQGIEAMGATVDLVQAIARPYTYEEKPRGTLGIVADRKRQVLVGAWAVAPLASEWIHYAVLAIRAEVPLEVLRDTIPQFPTYMEGYLSALHALPA